MLNVELGFALPLLGSDKSLDGINHILEFFLGHARVNTNPEAIIHDAIGNRERIPNHTIVFVQNVLLESWMFQEITSEEVAGLNLVILQVLGKFCTSIAGIW